ncbi:MAG: UvrD-helicase domain-containing protein [Bacteroidota bacterium]
MKKDIFLDLNESQREAVQHTNGPLMVLAGAGSGKTRVLTYRVAHLLTKGIDPFNILALTFTNKASREMKERITRLVGSSDAMNVWMGTFHSIFARLLRVDGQLIGYPSNFTIYDTDDTKSIMKAILKEQNLDPKQYPPPYVLHRISTAKNNLMSHEDYNRNAELTDYDKVSGKPQMGQLFTIYYNRLKKAQSMDFDDLLYNTNLLLRDFPEVLYKYQQKFQYILVDEYQDTNYAQYMIIKKLAANNENICVVGDDAQSIYGFRGANIQNILNFKSDYPDAQTIKLEQNYRSTKNIVNAANSVIQKNKKQYYKEIWTDNEEGNKIQLFKASSDNEEGAMIANSVFETKMNFQLPNSDFAVLYRTNAQSRSIEESMRRLNIPYKIYGGLSFYKRKEIKDMLAYFRLIINNKDEEALFRCINYPPRGIGDTSLQRVVIASSAYQTSSWDIIEQPMAYNLQVNSGIIQKLADFTTMIRSFSVQVPFKDAYELAKHIAATSGIFKELKQDESPEGMGRVENIDELLNAIKEFTEKENLIAPDGTLMDNTLRTLDLFMQDIALLTDADTEDKNQTDRVSLMTIHQAKGLEYPYVFVAGLEENLFPSMQSLHSREDLEEERRLFYVAITRAMKRLTLSYAENRYKYGEMIYSEKSRFIDEIDPQYLDVARKTPQQHVENSWQKKTVAPPLQKKPLGLKKINPSMAPPAVPSDFTASDTEDIRVGMTVEHQRFGRGKVMTLEGAGPNKKSTVLFDGIGAKQLLLQYAKLRIVN